MYVIKICVHIFVLCLYVNTCAKRQSLDTDRDLQDNQLSAFYIGSTWERIMIYQSVKGNNNQENRKIKQACQG